jgi:putative chitinase
MKMITLPQFKELFQNYNEDIYKHLITQMFVNEIIGFERESYFLAQMAHECNRFKDLEERMNYSAQGLLTTFSKYFKAIEHANQYARQPKKIADYVYANRMGNGPEESGDGSRYWARGFIHTTGKEKYLQASKYAGVNLVEEPESLKIPSIAAAVAAKDWHMSGLNQLSDKENYKDVTRIINGGYNGYQSRLNWLSKVQKFMHDNSVL